MGNNKMKMREALVAVQKKIEHLCGSFNVPNSLVAGRMEINGIINAALSEPDRNCDVGTADEQSKRYDEFCDIHDCRSDCPLFKADSCELAWAQMPYEEEGEVNGR